MVGAARVHPEGEVAEARAEAAADEQGAGAVAEEAGGAAVVEIEHAAHEVGADDERVTRAAAVEHARREAEGGDEAGAGRADVEGLGVMEAERVRDERRGVRHHLVGRRRRDEDEVDLLERDLGRAIERVLTGADRQIRQALAGQGVPALPDAGARLDPGVVDAEACGDLRVRDDVVRKGDADRRRRPDGDLRCPEWPCRA